MGITAVKPLTIGSRGSQLARWQANYIASRLQQLGIATKIEIIRTTGDHLQTASLVQAGGKGLFTKEIEDALLAGGIDLAVHSLKDLPTEITKGLCVAAIPEREDPRDAMVGGRLSDLPAGAVVGTSSGRRAAQLRVLRPDVRIEPVRGNVDTRLRKLKDHQYHAIMLAAAGLRRLGLESEITETLDPTQICPAAGQGALAIETRNNDEALTICRQLDHEISRQAVLCERAALARLGGGCQLPVGAFAEVEGDLLRLTVVVVSPGGSRHLRVSAQGPRERPSELGRLVAEDLLSRGAGAILSEIK
jgi:hydroxymethylbilane synthase